MNELLLLLLLLLLAKCSVEPRGSTAAVAAVRNISRELYPDT